MSIQETRESIIKYLKNLEKQLTESTNEKMVIKLDDELKQLINYEQIMRNPLAHNPNTRDVFLEKIIVLQLIKEIHNKIILILKKSPYKDIVNLSTAEMYELDADIEIRFYEWMNLFHELVQKINLVFGDSSKSIQDFIFLGEETEVFMNGVLAIEQENTSAFPINGTIEEKMKWIQSLLNSVADDNINYFSNFEENFPYISAPLDKRMERFSKEFGTNVPKVIGGKLTLSKTK